MASLHLTAVRRLIRTWRRIRPPWLRLRLRLRWWPWLWSLSHGTAQQQAFVVAAICAMLYVVILFMDYSRCFAVTSMIPLQRFTHAHTITAADLADESAVLELNDPSKRQLLVSDQANTLCRRHGFSLYPHEDGSEDSVYRRRRRRVYELLMLNNELDWLEIHLATLWDHVDFFVIVESDRTFTGLEKPLLLQDHWSRFQKWENKIIYHMLERPDDETWEREGRTKPLSALDVNNNDAEKKNTHGWTRSPWDFEDLQRDATFEQATKWLEPAWKPQNGDVLIVADVDEIPRPYTIAVLRACMFPLRLTLRSRFFYYGFDLLHRGEEWPHPQATMYVSDWFTITPTHLRNGDGGIMGARNLVKADLWNAAWHCSNCFGTLTDMLRKMESFSHANLNNPEYRDPERIVDRVMHGRDLWDLKEQEFDRIEGNEDVPPPLKSEEGQRRWGYLLDRSGPNAGFSDYHGKQGKTS